jgi:hypothetical protein
VSLDIFIGCEKIKNPREKASSQQRKGEPLKNLYKKYLQSSLISTLSNHTTFSQDQTGATVPLLWVRKIPRAFSASNGP